MDLIKLLYLIPIVVILIYVIWSFYSDSELGKQRKYYRKMIRRTKQDVKFTYKLKKIREDPDYKAFMKFNEQKVKGL